MKIRNIPKFYSLPLVQKLYTRIWRKQIRKKSFDLENDIIEFYTILDWRTITIRGSYSEKTLIEVFNQGKADHPIPSPDVHLQCTCLLDADDFLEHPLALRIFRMIWWRWLRHCPDERVVRITGWRNCIVESKNGYHDRKRVAFCFWWFD